ncbi:serine/threonine-protein kinase [Amycolatopsis suaedae]|uniref:serine/threonine-protein kinase n=1 Tax=Amycolatopsis suaedae TaxID=2510978 RepID=UPI0013EF3964|nr:serine/threonine-protein kinase [Amycolatopsis suaedae]
MTQDGDTRPHHESEGPPAVVAGRYELRSPVGEGSTATVYRAFDRTDGRLVAVKLFHSVERRFPREVQVLRGLRCPGLIELFDAGLHSGRQFLVMRLVEGPTLAQRLAEGPLELDETVTLGQRLAAALDHVHAADITHRDVKPGNVILGEDGPALTDFGIARVADATKLTVTGAVMGTAAYLSPEQVRGEGVGPPSDVYALGLVLLECLTGQRVYPGPMAEAAVARLRRAPTVPKGLPPALARLLKRMTAGGPATRPTAAEAAAELERVRAGEQAAQRRPVLWLGVPGAAACLVTGALLLGGGTPPGPGSAESPPVRSAPAAPPDGPPSAPAGETGPVSGGVVPAADAGRTTPAAGDGGPAGTTVPPGTATPSPGQSPAPSSGQERTEEAKPVSEGKPGKGKPDNPPSSRGKGPKGD